MKYRIRLISIVAPFALTISSAFADSRECNSVADLQAEGLVDVIEAEGVEMSGTAEKKGDVAGGETPVASASEQLPTTQRKVSHRPRQNSWWLAPQSGKLNVLAVRSGEFSKSIVIETDGSFDDASAVNSAVTVRNANGDTVDGQWNVAAKKSVLLMPLAAGKYQIEFNESFEDAQGKVIAKEMRGPVVVR